jgi:hypothetical protein
VSGARGPRRPCAQSSACRAPEGPARLRSSSKAKAGAPGACAASGREGAEATCQRRQADEGTGSASTRSMRARQVPAAAARARRRLVVRSSREAQGGQRRTRGISGGPCRPSAGRARRAGRPAAAVPAAGRVRPAPGRRGPRCGVRRIAGEARRWRDPGSLPRRPEVQRRLPPVRRQERLRGVRAADPARRGRPGRAFAGQSPAARCAPGWTDRFATIGFATTRAAYMFLFCSKFGVPVSESSATSIGPLCPRCHSPRTSIIYAAQQDCADSWFGA